MPTRISLAAGLSAAAVLTASLLVPAEAQRRPGAPADFPNGYKAPIVAVTPQAPDPDDKIRVSFRSPFRLPRQYDRWDVSLTHGPETECRAEPWTSPDAPPPGTMFFNPNAEARSESHYVRARGKRAKGSRLVAVLNPSAAHITAEWRDDVPRRWCPGDWKIKIVAHPRSEPTSKGGSILTIKKRPDGKRLFELPLRVSEGG